MIRLCDHGRCLRPSVDAVTSDHACCGYHRHAKVIGYRQAPQSPRVTQALGNPARTGQERKSA